MFYALYNSFHYVVWFQSQAEQTEFDPNCYALCAFSLPSFFRVSPFSPFDYIVEDVQKKQHERFLTWLPSSIPKQHRLELWQREFYAGQVVRVALKTRLQFHLYGILQTALKSYIICRYQRLQSEFHTDCSTWVNRTDAAMMALMAGTWLLLILQRCY